jgi:hypothetical protein
MTKLTRARALLRADSAFEAALAVVLAGGGALDWLTGGDFPIGRTAVIVSGVALGAGQPVLLYLANRADARYVRTVGALNGATALAGLVWLLADPGFSATGATIVAVAVAEKTGISALQFRAVSGARRSRAAAGAESSA